MATAPLYASGRTRPSIALVVTPFSDENLRLAAQIGAEDIVYYNMSTMPSTTAELLAAKARVASFGLRLSVVEGGPPMDKIVLGAPGRDEQIEGFKACLRAMGEAGIHIL
jgi:mannonate dehydratase